jgi:long-subunit fatty acid transport protein
LDNIFDETKVIRVFKDYSVEYSYHRFHLEEKYQKIKQMKRFSIVLAFILMVGVTFAQNEVDALRYSRLDYGGTARSMAMGNAFGALGGDISTLSTNPAGLGLFKKSEFVFTPSVSFGKTESVFYDDYNDEYYFNGNIHNLGLVLVGDMKIGGVKNFQFGFAKNRIADFNNGFSIHGENYESSLADYYQHQAMGLRVDQLDPFGARQFFDAYVIDYDGSETIYFNDLDSGVLQTMNVKTTGHIDEYAFSGGVNVQDRVYVGATVGIPVIEFEQRSTFTERDHEDKSDFFNKLQREEYLSTTGTGINLKIGAILRPTDWLRMGAAYHTPTRYEMEDYWDVKTIGFYDQAIEDGNNATVFESDKAVGINDDYYLITPQRANASIAFIFGKKGVLSAEYEWVDYSAARLGSGVDYSEENDRIRENYTDGHNLKVGAEARMGFMSFRAGTGYSSDPFKTSVNDQSYFIYSGGIGMNFDGLFLDFAYTRRVYSDKYYVYDPAWVQAAENTYKQGQLIMTAGFKF